MQRKKKKKKLAKKLKQKCFKNVEVYIHTYTLFGTDKACQLSHDRQKERPTTNKTAIVLTATKIWL
jgi:hypothetical protein